MQHLNYDAKSGSEAALNDPTKRKVIAAEEPPRVSAVWHVYIVKCRDGKLYTGITTDIERRLQEHNTGHGGRFTRFRRPVSLMYSEKASNRSAALKQEAQIRRLKRSDKLALI